MPRAVCVFVVAAYFASLASSVRRFKGLAVLEEAGALVEKDTSTQAVLPSKGEKRAAESLAKQFGETLVKKNGQPVVLGKGGFGIVFALENKKVLKLGRRLQQREAIIGMNLPHTKRLLPILGYKKGSKVTGEVMPLMDGELADYGKKFPYATPEEGLQIAADLSVGLYALHNKIKGYSLLHCDLTPANTGWVMVNGTRRALLFDIGLAIVRKLSPGENASATVFNQMPRADYDKCKRTDWGHPQIKEEPSYYSAPFRSVVEWREIGVTLLRVVEVGKDGWNWETYEELSKHVNASQGNKRTDLVESLLCREDFRGILTSLHPKKCPCNWKCSAQKRLKQTKLFENKEKDPNGPAARLFDLIWFLMFEHDTIKDELKEVLGHPSFASLSLSPLKLGESIAVKTPNAEFRTKFSARTTRLPA